MLHAGQCIYMYFSCFHFYAGSYIYGNIHYSHLDDLPWWLRHTTKDYMAVN